MAWTTPVDQTTGHLVTATEFNAQIIDNLKYLHGDAGTIDLSAGGPLNANLPYTASSGSGSWTPAVGSGFMQRFNITSGSTLTINSPGAPPTNTSSLLVLLIQNSTGGTVTLTYNAIYLGVPATLTSGGGYMQPFLYLPAPAKWVSIVSAVQPAGGV